MVDMVLLGVSNWVLLGRASGVHLSEQIVDERRHVGDARDGPEHVEIRPHEHRRGAVGA